MNLPGTVADSTEDGHVHQVRVHLIPALGRKRLSLVDAAAGYRFEAAVVLALAYGMRRGEVLGLHWSALDWQAGILRVTHSVKRIQDRDASSGRRTRLVVSELKTPKSRRVLALTPELVARFRQHLARQVTSEQPMSQ